VTPSSPHATPRDHQRAAGESPRADTSGEPTPTIGRFESLSLRHTLTTRTNESAPTSAASRSIGTA